MRKFSLIAGIALLILGTLLLLAFSGGMVADVTITPMLPQPPAEAQSPVFPAGSNGYLIVACDSLLKLDAMQGFIRHKRSLGFRVEAVSVEEIEKSHTSGERADRVRQYLKGNAARLGLRYLLLVGDPDPADVRVKLPVPEELPPYVVSTPSRSIGGTHVWDRHDGDIGSEGRSRRVILTGPKLQVLRPGTLRYWYVNCTAPGKIRLLILRKKGEKYEAVFASEPTKVTMPGVAVRSTRPVQLEAGDFVGFELPAEGGAKVAVVETPGVECAIYRDSLPEGDSSGLASAVILEGIPLIQCSIYFEPQDRVGSVPSKMCWPMGTYNGVYSALLRDSCLSQCPTDAYYANLSGDWDRNGNGFFGETFLKFFRYDGGAKAGALSPGDLSTPEEAFLPELLVGRIPFDSPETVSAILEKTIAYESAQDKEWRRHCLLGADPLAPDTDSYALCELIRSDICDPAGFRTTRFYTEHDFDDEVQSPKRYGYKPEVLVTLGEMERNKTAGYERFSELWSKQHPGLVIWSSHANTDICRNIITLRDETNPDYPQAITRRYVDALDDSHAAIVFAAACSVTQQEDYYLGTRKKRTVLEHDWEPRPNLGRELLKNGAVAVVGHPRSTWFRYGWDPRDNGGGCLSLAFSFARELVTGGHDVAYSLAAAVREYHARWGSELADGENIIGFQVYGDPSLKLGVGVGDYVGVVRPRPPVLSVTGPTEPARGVEVHVKSVEEVEIEVGRECGIDVIQAAADGSEEWLEADGFTISEERFLHGGHSYYSTPARHRRTTLSLNFPLLPGQELTADFACWYSTEPGLDYVVFEKSSDGRRWEPLEVYSGASTKEPLFDQHNPQWLKKWVRFSTGASPAYLRFRYVTNDQYRKVPHVGFYMDSFSLKAKSGEVRYITGWQRIRPGKNPGVLNYRPPGPGTYYLRVRAAGPYGAPGWSSQLYRLTVSESRPASAWERVSGALGLATALLAAFGLGLVVFAAVPRRCGLK